MSARRADRRRPGPAALRLVRRRPALRRVPRRRVGPAGRRRPAAVREDLPRRIPVRPELADDPAQARAFPRGVRRLRPGHASPAYGARDVDRLLDERRHRPPSRQDRIDDQQREARCSSCRPSSASLAAYAWSWEPAASDRPAALTWEALRAMPTTPASTALSKDLKKRGLDVRRADDGLRVHAGDGARERSPRGLLRAARGASAHRRALKPRPARRATAGRR